MNDQSPPIQFAVPRQDLVELSFTIPKPQRIKRWVKDLPMANLGETAHQLYLAVPELTRLQTSPKNRFAMLEEVRGPVDIAIEGMSKHFLNQPIILPERPLKVAKLAQALQKNLTNGYKLVIHQYTHSGKRITNAEERLILAQSIQRAIVSHSQTLLRCYQLYAPIPPKLWLELHNLFRLAEQYQLLDQHINDPLNKYENEPTILDTYLRAILMGCVKPNQLRQQDLSLVYHALELWVKVVGLNQSEDIQGVNLFAIPLFKDLPPIYRSIVKNPATNGYQHIGTNVLVRQLCQHLSDAESLEIIVPGNVSKELLDHLICTWSVQRKRTFERTSANGSVEVCIGLTDMHYFLSERMDFGTFLNLQKEQEQQQKKSKRIQAKHPSRDVEPTVGDVWEQALDAGKAARIEGVSISTESIEKEIQASKPKEVKVERHFTHQVSIINTSPGGFCLQWNSKTPVQVRTGEVLGVKEAKRPNWSIGVIRWLRVVSGQQTQMGVELLSPAAVPYGASVQQKTGEPTEFQRVMMLPELKLINQAATLITSKIPFAEGQKLRLNRKGDYSLVQLTKRILSTASINQFEFRPLDQKLIESEKASEPKTEFDSLWKTL